MAAFFFDRGVNPLNPFFQIRPAAAPPPVGVLFLPSRSSSREAAPLSECAAPPTDLTLERSRSRFFFLSGTRGNGQPPHSPLFLGLFPQAISFPQPSSLRLFPSPPTREVCLTSSLTPMQPSPDRKVRRFLPRASGTPNLPPPPSLPQQPPRPPPCSHQLYSCVAPITLGPPPPPALKRHTPGSFFEPGLFQSHDCRLPVFKESSFGPSALITTQTPRTDQSALGALSSYKRNPNRTFLAARPHPLF